MNPKNFLQLWVLPSDNYQYEKIRFHDSQFSLKLQKLMLSEE